MSKTTRLFVIWPSLPTLALVLACTGTAAEQGPPVTLSPQAAATVQEYQSKIGGRFGALAVSTDGTKAAYHICRSYLAQNCDDHSLEDTFITIPSGRLAADYAMGRCGGGCVLVFVNERQVRPIAVQ